ncbi:hypothetical protein M427DRAFT_38269 [Gonapodya prolifera JEL478]|uniref:Hyaluronan/mRNA-binding protein domain-containing protein n=1 Tax=Gonapodya prolifera (strain JEL478) TaxID=1344416 RepID=A0A138ZZB3_GONPJ|nr:hypothetical protein M427DRAFT_38269 [Gonapodya prolifera JEL478]|eukprot:KXS09844.1 hypothetical protein M427DRAFT_38269 [Gonapodya prolifera JEL478]
MTKSLPHTAPKDQDSQGFKHGDKKSGGGKANWGSMDEEVQSYEKQSVSAADLPSPKKPDEHVKVISQAEAEKLNGTK